MIVWSLPNGRTVTRDENDHWVVYDRPGRVLKSGSAGDVLPTIIRITAITTEGAGDNE